MVMAISKSFAYIGIVGIERPLRICIGLRIRIFS